MYSMNKEVEKVIWEAPKPGSQNGPWRLDVNDFVSSKNLLATKSMLVHFGPGSIAGDHRHQQQEVVIGLSGDLYLAWRDAQGERHEEELRREDGKLQAFVIASGVPHLIENRSSAAFGLMQVWHGLVDEPVLLEGEESLRPQE